MLGTLGVVQACFGSRQARAGAARKLDGKSVLEWIVRRATDCQQLDGVVVLTNDDPENAFVKNLVPLDVPVYVARQPDPLGRFAAILKEYPTRSAVRIHAQTPFVDPELIDRLVVVARSHPNCDYVGYQLRDGRPAILAPVGLCAEWIRTTALWRADQEARLPQDRQDVTRYLYTHPEKFQVCLVPAPPQIDREDIRLSVALEEDWELTITIYEALGPERLEWQKIATLLDHQPSIRKRMAALNQVEMQT
ncbi:MAG: NTP transferase domain-containing protein [Thermoguttaceae bacterium]|nr:NTP transferase domain-containing protein [Thermoguttaceae bacterium]MDW8039212.1 NTP transferase domain-containing protein [Thermoguttaceae bacterium]